MTESTEDLKENVLSENILLLVQQTEVWNAVDALTILLHGFMTETGFIPYGMDESEKDSKMPKNWMKAQFYRIQYFHKNVPQMYCWMTCLPLYNNLSVVGEIDSCNSEAHVQLTLFIDRYIKNRQEFSISDPATQFLNLKDLSICFKDRFCSPLLKLLHETAGISYPFGFDGLLNDLKLDILELLPVESLVACSRVNKKFNELANSPYLWKNLYLRDFKNSDISDTPSTSQDGNEWKKAYKRQYLKRKKFSGQPGSSHPISYPYPMRIYPIAPNLQVDPRIDFDFSIYDAFPRLRPQFHPYFHPGFPENLSAFRRFW